jgi:phage baseplate assembly protein W
MSEDVAHLKESLTQILQTREYERTMESHIYSDIDSSVFEPNDESLQGLLTLQVLEACELEPRVTVTEEDLTFYEDNEKLYVDISFLVNDIHPYDMGMILDKMGIAVRTGTHCTQPLLDQYQIEGTVRASMVFYNTFEEVDFLVDAVKKATDMLS